MYHSFSRGPLLSEHGQERGQVVPLVIAAVSLENPGESAQLDTSLLTRALPASYTKARPVREYDEAPTTGSSSSCSEEVHSQTNRLPGYGPAAKCCLERKIPG